MKTAFKYLLALLLPFLFSFTTDKSEVQESTSFQLAIFVGTTPTPQNHGPGHVIIQIGNEFPVISRYWSPNQNSRSEICYIPYSEMEKTADATITLETFTVIKGFTNYTNFTIVSGGVGYKKVVLKGKLKNLLSYSTSIGIIQL